MQEHSGQVRGQARAPVGPSAAGGGAGFGLDGHGVSPMTAPHPTRPPFPTSALYPRHPSTPGSRRGLSELGAAAGAHACGQRCALLCTCRFQRTLSSSLSSPNRKVPRFYWTTETSGGGLSCPSPPRHPCPFHAASRARASRSARTLCLGPRKGPWKNSSSQFSRRACELPCQHGAQKNPALLRALCSCRRFPPPLSLDGNRLHIESAV